MKILICLFVCLLPIFAQDTIPLSNSNFDEDLLLEGEWQTSLSGWSIVGTAGVFNPTETQYPGEDGSRSNVGFTNNGTLIQVTNELLAADTLYTLSLDVGRRNDLSNQPPVTLRFVAGGEVLAQSGGYAIDPGQWRNATLTLVATDAQPIGQPLEIHLISTDTQVHYDNLSLMKVSVSGGEGSGVTVDAITVDTTLHVPSEYATIQDALKALDMRPISTDAIVTIQVADGTYTDYKTIVVDHPDGNKIHILGNITDSSLCTLMFKPGVNGVSVRKGRTLGLLNGFTLQGDNHTKAGIQAQWTSHISTGSEIVVHGFYHGVMAAYSSSINSSSIEVFDNHDGFFSTYSASIAASYTTSKNNVGNGYALNGGSSMLANGSTAENNGFGGFNSWTGCTLIANNSFSIGNIYGYMGSALGLASAVNSMATANNTDFFMYQGGMILQ